jgi:hypothetical protein
MAVTTPDSIVTPDDGDDYALVQDLGAMADSVQDAITEWKNYGTGTDAERLALTVSSNPPLKSGLLWYSTDTEVLWRYQGSLWSPRESNWINYTPSSSTVTVGAGGSGTFRYRYLGGMVEVDFKIVLGSGFSIAAPGARFALPVTRAALAHAWQPVPEMATVNDVSSTTNFRVSVTAYASSVTEVHLGTGLPQVTGNVTATDPFTLAAGDVISGRFTYEAA